MEYTYIIKSSLGVEISTTCEVFNKVKKDVASSTYDARRLYIEHCNEGLEPTILKFKDRKYQEISIEEVQSDIEKKKAPAGAKKAIKSNKKNAKFLNMGHQATIGKGIYAFGKLSI